MIILIRLLPFFTAFFEVAVFVQQIKNPLQYPWIVLAGVGFLPFASLCIAWRRIRFFDWLEKMMPSFVLLAALAFALLLSEGAFANTVIVVIAALSSLISLELLFILAFDPSRYPVNGLSRVNIGYVPIAIWYVAANSSGLLIFMHMERFWHVLIMVILGAVLFRTTGHPGATREQNAVWIFVGSLIGLHAGLLGIFLPLSMAMHGIIATILLCTALRARRYMYDPKPTIRQAWAEGIGAVIALVAALATAKWL
jgi:hypothetical protein